MSYRVSFNSSKKKIFNDPIYGFIEIPHPLLFELLNHTYFQRLRRIRQLGMTQMVYPGANHTRFQHAVGAMHLTHRAVETLRSKGHSISDEEAFSVCAAVLLHDIGHGPFSHSLERQILNCDHEAISLQYFNLLNEELGGKLSMAKKIFEGSYKRKFLCRLVSGQLDMDRMDYLNRDSFFCGVTEGTISSERLLKMLELSADELAIESKGIYSVENFIIARRLMYWQVYLHKAVLGAENLLIRIVRRAKELVRQGMDVPASKPFAMFLAKEYSEKSLQNIPEIMVHFSDLDDYDVFASIKAWKSHPDKILSYLCRSLVDRNLFQTEIHNTPPTKEKIQSLKLKAKKAFGIKEEECDYFVVAGGLENKAYNPQSGRINILYKDGSIKDIAEASDHLNISLISKTVKKYFLSYPKEMI